MSAENESHENIYYEADEDDLYDIDNTSLEKNKETKEWRKRTLESKIKYIYDIENQNGMIFIHENEVNKIVE